MKVAILGYGKEGHSALRYYREKNAEITVFDEDAAAEAQLPVGVAFKGGKDCFSEASGFDVVVRSPAIHPGRITTDGRITDSTKIFFAECPAPIIGVTGTKGKGTVSSLIFEMLKNAGVGVHLAGNIGVPMLDILPDVRVDDVVVLELSSFQLWQLKASPDVAVVLMIEPDHLEVHANMNEYVGAKANIAKWQADGDLVIFHPDNTYAELIASRSAGTKLRYGKPPAAHVKAGNFMVDEHKLCSSSNLLIPGKHNIDNACAAITAAWQYTHNIAAIVQALASFKGLPHRLGLVREVEGISYYDDSIATTPGSAIAAIEAFKAPKILILGGSAKGADFTELAKKVKKAKMRRVLLIGDEATRIKAAFDKAGFKDYDVLGTKTTMKKIVKAAAAAAEKDDVVILSPACASFGMFKNYGDRGEQFVEAVEGL